MMKNPIIKKLIKKTIKSSSALLVLICFMDQGLWAKEVGPELSKEVPCGVLERFEGEVQIMDPTRSHLIDSLLGAAIPCGGWVSVKSGWARVKHRQGYVLQFAQQTFAEVYDNQNDEVWTGKEHVVLYSGKFYAIAKKGMGEFRAMTANARVRASGAVFVVNYSNPSDETQLLTLEGVAQIENRFEDTVKLTVKAGESSVLNFQAFRVVPSTPAAIKLTSLKQKLKDLSLSDKEYAAAVQSTKARGDRKWASVLVEDEKTISRSIAGAQEKSQKGHYERYPASVGNVKAQELWMERLVGGEKNAKEFLFPKSGEANDHHARAAVGTNTPTSLSKHDPLQTTREDSRTEENLEKKRIINELSKMREDEL